MGGLVARNFSNPGASGYAYRNTRNRYQGTFRDVVTLDTPETGSALAYYLDYVFANKTADPLDSPESGALWLLSCAPNPLETVRECMSSLDTPLAYASHDLAEGAVYSLIPDNLNPQGQQQFAALPDPNIDNATWFAIAGSYPDDGHLPRAVLRGFFNTFIAATYPITATPMTLTDMLGTPDSDVIVTEDSQLYHVIPGQSMTFQGLSHTSVPKLGPAMTLLGRYGAFSDAAVTNSAAVNRQIGNWLGYGSEAVSQQSATSALKGETPAVDAASKKTMSALDGKRIFVADRRVTASLPEHDVYLGQPVEIPLKLSEGNIVAMSIMQRSNGRHLQNRSYGRPVGVGNAKIVNDGALLKTIEVIPLQLGQVDLDLFVAFADGGISRTSYSLNVVPSAKGLKKFSLNHGSNAVAVVLDDENEDREVWLAPEVYYDGLDFPIFVNDSTGIKFTVKQSESDPVILLDRDGMVHGLRPGKATITADFDGIRDSLMVEVYTKDTAPVGYSSAHGDTNY
jgi:hypothetical protein